MATNSVLLPIVGSSAATPTEFTAQSPSFNRYFPIPNTPIRFFGDYSYPSTAPTPANGIIPIGFLRVEYHVGNQWNVVDYYTSINGASIATLLG